MITKNEANATGDAPKSERRATDPGLGDQLAPNEEPNAPAKQFDPRRFQANTMPPGFRSVIVGTELPSMPKNRIEDTIPPTDVAEVVRRAEPVRPWSASPKPIMTEFQLGSDEPSRVEALAFKALSYRLAVPLGILFFAAGALVVLLVSRGREPSAHVEAPEAIDVVAAPNPIAPKEAKVPPPVEAPASATTASFPIDVDLDEPPQKQRTVTVPKPPPRVVNLPKSNATKARTRNETPD